MHREGAIPLGEAMRIDDSPEIHFTPKHDDRLNMTVFERNALQRLCGARRMDDRSALTREVRSLASPGSQSN
jgi:hypothetical protein